MGRFLGSAGPSKVWHHVVEQCQERRFGATQINNTRNVIELPEGVHRKVSRYYSSKRAYTGGLTVRQWLRKQGMSFDEEFQFGMKVIRECGG